MILNAFDASSEANGDACDVDAGIHVIDADVKPGFGSIVIKLGDLERQMIDGRRESINLACQCGAVVFGSYKRIYGERR